VPYVCHATGSSPEFVKHMAAVIANAEAH